MAWVLGGLAVWAGAALLIGVLVGSGIARADRPGAVARPVSAARPARVRRRALPLPPFGVALAAVAVALEAGGYAVRLAGSSGGMADVFSMEAPLSLPRMYVAALFGVAALAALAGAGRMPGRRAWWTAVGVVAGVVALVKAGGQVHTWAVGELADVLTGPAAVVLSAVLAVGVLAGLWWLSRTERRDRRRVLGTLGGYALAAVGLSALTAFVEGRYGIGSTWAAAATFGEESAEALAGVSFLVAVLAGVAPRLVLPREWATRRAADAHTLEVAERHPARVAPGDLSH